MERPRQTTEDNVENEKRPLSIYVHLPFCSVKCPFCDFYTRPDTNPNEKIRYTKSLLQELEMHQILGWKKGSRVTSVYFGGGTPSLTSIDDLTSILEKIKKIFSHEGDMEITLEVNPEDVTPEKILSWKGLGINRFSLGLEAMEDLQLKRLGRAGTHSHNVAALEYFAKAQVNLSVDLIFGLEGQTLENWMHTLESVLKWNPQHISAYNLTIEEKTKYWVEVKRKTLSPTPDDVCAEMFLQGRYLLESEGYHAYEISNFARPGFESKHNQSYWTGQNYWGLGVAAHSLQRNESNIRRFWNPKSIQTYMKYMDENKPALEDEILGLEKHFSERVMTALRTSTGIDLEYLEHDLGIPTPGHVLDFFNRIISNGFAVRSQETYTLNSKGLLFSDELFLELF